MVGRRCKRTDAANISDRSFLTYNKLSTTFFKNRWERREPLENFTRAILQFTNSHLFFHRERLTWLQILDWEVITEKAPQLTYISIEYYDNEKNICKTNLKDVAIHKIDCLLLLTFFKAKYGNK